MSRLDAVCARSGAENDAGGLTGVMVFGSIGRIPHTHPSPKLDPRRRIRWHRASGAHENIASPCDDVLACCQFSRCALLAASVIGENGDVLPTLLSCIARLTSSRNSSRMPPRAARAWWTLPTQSASMGRRSCNTDLGGGA